MSEQSEELEQEVLETEVPEQEPEVEPEEKPEEPTQSRSQNAKQRLRRKLREEQQARQAAEERASRLEDKFSAVEQKLDTVINPPPARPNRVDFETEENYEDALFEWRDAKKPQSPVTEPVKEPVSAPTGAPADPVPPQIRQNWESQMETAHDKYEDFDDRIFSIPKEAMTDAMTFAIMESETGGEIAYFLGENHNEAARIARLPLIAQVREIDKLATKFKPTTTQAPDPITPPKGGDSPAKDPANMTPDEYLVHRRSTGMPH